MTSRPPRQLDSRSVLLDPRKESRCPPGTSVLPELRIAVANFQPGGVDADNTGRWDQMMHWDKTVGALRAWQPHLVLGQEISAAAPGGLRASLWTTANTLGMIPLLGPPAPALVTGAYPAILIAAHARLVILDSGPVPCPAETGFRPAWCEALVQVPGWSSPIRAYSVGLPARSSTEQRVQADYLASRVADRGELAMAGGNWNSYSRADPVTAAMLEAAPLHLRPARMRYTPQDQALSPNYDVHDVLASVGLHDAVTVMAPGQRDPHDVTAAMTSRGGRVDRIYLTRELAAAASRHDQRDSENGDRRLLMLTLDGSRAARAIPRLRS
jgi:hypothetical protein